MFTFYSGRNVRQRHLADELKSNAEISHAARFVLFYMSIRSGLFSWQLAILKRTFKKSFTKCSELFVSLAKEQKCAAEIYIVFEITPSSRFVIRLRLRYVHFNSSHFSCLCETVFKYE